VADNEIIARRAAKLVKITYEDILPLIVTIEDAIKHESYLDAPRKSFKFVLSEILFYITVSIFD